MATVLAFNITDPNKINELNVLSLRLGFVFREIPPDAQRGTIRDLLAGKKVSGKPGFRDEMMVMDGLSHPDLNFLLNELIRTGHPIGLKAVVTPTNRNWTALMLHTQLVAEHELMKRSNK